MVNSSIKSTSNVELFFPVGISFVTSSSLYALHPLGKSNQPIFWISHEIIRKKTFSLLFPRPFIIILSVSESIASEEREKRKKKSILTRFNGRRENGRKEGTHLSLGVSALSIKATEWIFVILEEGLFEQKQ